MAQKKKPVKKTRSRASRSRVVSSKGSSLSRIQTFLRKGPVLLLTIILFGAIGTALLVNTYALPFGRNVPANDAARGLNYNGLTRVDTGPCAGQFKIEHANEHAENACVHPDPGPKNVDVRERDKTIEKELADQAAYDAQYLPAGEDATVAEGTAPLVAETNNGGYSLSEVGGRNWPCIGNGTDGPRVRWIYAYKASNNNRLNSLRSGFESIARRTTSVVYNSSMASGNKVQKIRYATTEDCTLRISPVAIRGDATSFSNIISQVRAAGYDRADRKYIVMVDAADNCGLGQMYVSDTNGPSNPNNSGGMYAAIWRPCWNYAEPHELGHMLGAVQRTTPHATAGSHCSDENDVMCYDDGTAGSNMTNSCTVAAKHWFYDCGFNDYYDRGAETTYLSNHWNIAENQYLTN